MLARRLSARRAGSQGYAVAEVSFGGRMALFFVLIALLPTAALIGILLFISNDSRRGKADAHLAASLETGAAVYQRRSAAADGIARRLARDPELAQAMRSGDRAQLQAFARRATATPGVVRVEVRDTNGNVLAAAGSPDAIAFGEVGLTTGGE